MEEAAGDEPVPLAFARPTAPKRPKSKTSELLPDCSKPPLPLAISARKASTLSAIRMKVAGALAEQARRSPTPLTTLVRWPAHSGQRIPTGVGVMQSGQIGRPQEEQETAGLAVGVAVTSLGHGDEQPTIAADGRSPAQPGSTRPWSARR